MDDEDTEPVKEAIPDVEPLRYAVRVEKMHVAALQRYIHEAETHLLALDPEEEKEAVRGERMHILALHQRLWRAEAALKNLEQEFISRTVLNLDKILVP